MFTGILMKIGFSILGGFKWIGQFLKDNWKWVLPILLALGAYWYHNHAVKTAYGNGYLGGVKDEQAAIQERMDAENKKNREFEQMLNSAISEFGRGLITETAERVAIEAKLNKSIQTIIRDNPIYEQCQVDQGVTDARNQIRKLGPGPVARMELPDAE